MFCGEIKNVSRDLKMHTEKALEVCYLGKDTKLILDKGFSRQRFICWKKFQKNIILTTLGH
jgi:hypothetical protein